MTPQSFDALTWDDYHAMREYMEREQQETSDALAAIRQR